MKQLHHLSISLLFFAFACGNDKEEFIYPFDQSPYVEFETLEYFDVQGLDTLTLSMVIWDEEGDVGLNTGEVSSPYHIFDLIIDSNDTPVGISGEEYQLPYYKAPVVVELIGGDNTYIFFPDEKSLFSEVDNRPVYSCESYEIIEADTFFIQPNENQFNLLLEFENRDGDIDFQEIFGSEDCNLGNFNARIPFVELDPFNRLAAGRGSSFRISWLNKYARRVEYRMLSQAFRLLFLDNEFSVSFKVKDRALNESNTGQTDFMTLDQIKVN